jgi:hypothetical protein
MSGEPWKDTFEWQAKELTKAAVAVQIAAIASVKLLPRWFRTQAIAKRQDRIDEILLSQAEQRYLWENSTL